MILRLLSLALLPCLLHAAFDARSSRFRKAVMIPAGSQFAVIPLDREALAGARADLADLRIVWHNQEQPYVLGTAAARTDSRAVFATLVDQAYLPGVGVQVVLDLAARGLHNRVRFQTGEVNFRSKVKIETSDNRERWATVRSDAEIFDFSTDDRHVWSLDVTYPDSTRRYVRVTIAAWKRPYSLASATLDVYRNTPAARTALGSFTPPGEPDVESKALLYVLDLGSANLPVDCLEFDFGEGYFQRAVDVESSDDQKEWRSLERGVLARLPGETAASVEFAPSRQRYLRVRLYHGDDPPVEVRRIGASCVERYLTIQPKPGGDYWLYYGRPDAGPAQYDLAAVLARANPAPAVRASVEPQQANPAYVTPPPNAGPWTERHPALLYTVLILAVLGLGLIAVRQLREGQKK